jgi:hypothetical protein
METQDLELDPISFTRRIIVDLTGHGKRKNGNAENLRQEGVGRSCAPFNDGIEVID